MTDYQRWLKRVIRFAECRGWTVHKNGHIKFKSPEGRVVVCSYSPRSSDVMESVAKDLKRAGLVIDL